MNVLTAIRERHCFRAFQKKEISKEMIHQILEHARFAPSGVNTQPWKVVVIQGDRLQKMGNAIIAARENNQPENPDYCYYPKEWFTPYKERRKECGLLLYSSVNIALHDAENRKIQWYKNYHFFGAPIGLLFFLNRQLEKGSWLDMGMFLQNVMLAARGFGLETCPEASLAEYPDIVRSHTEVNANYAVVCGMALGYADYDQPINQYRTPREQVNSFTEFLDF